MTPLTFSEIEQKLAELEEKIAGLESQELRASMRIVLAYLEDRRKETREGQANLDRAIDRLRNRLKE